MKHQNEHPDAGPSDDARGAQLKARRAGRLALTTVLFGVFAPFLLAMVDLDPGGDLYMVSFGAVAGTTLLLACGSVVFGMIALVVTARTKGVPRRAKVLAALSILVGGLGFGLSFFAVFVGAGMALGSGP